MLPIRAVLFDYGLVLSGPPDPMAHRRMETILRTTQADLHNAYWRHRENYDLGVLTGITFWRTVSNELNHPLHPDELAQLLQADLDLWTQPNQPMINWAIALQTAGISTGILSNMGDAMETGITNHFPWISGFPHRTFSHSLGIVKPDARIYRHAISGIGAPLSPRFLSTTASRTSKQPAWSGSMPFNTAVTKNSCTSSAVPASQTCPRPSLQRRSAPLDPCPKVEQSRTNG